MASGTGAGTETPRPSSLIGVYALLVLSLAALATSLGRGMFSLLIETIEADLGLSDAEIGMLFGFLSVALYALISLPVARLVDGGRRRTILGAGLALWSLTTAAAAFAGGFALLLLVRIGAGAGEAAVGPASYSMLADLHPRARLARAIAVTGIGAIAGSGLALVAGGFVVAVLGWLPVPHLPLLGELRPWQTALVLTALGGMAVAMLACTLAEPARPVTTPSTDEVARHLAANGKAYAPIVAATTLMALLSYGQAAWTPTFAMRAFGWSAEECGMLLGLTLLVAGPLGALLGGHLAGRLVAKGRRDAEMRVVLWSALVAVPAAILFPLMPSAGLMVAMNGLFWFAASWALGPQTAALQLLTPNRMRARVTALALFAFNVIGVGLGPMIVPLLAGGEDIGPALTLLAAVAGPLAILAAWLSLKPYAERLTLPKPSP